MQNLTSVAAPMLEQISVLNSRLSLSLAGSQLRNITAIRRDVHTLLRERRDAVNNGDRVAQQLLHEQLHLLQQEFKDRRSFDHMLLNHCHGNNNNDDRNGNHDDEENDDDDDE